MSKTNGQGIPSHARRVYSGDQWQVWSWEQEQFDGSKKIYERAVRSDSVTVIPIVDKKILIQHQEQPVLGSFISLPGGFQESDDPLEDAKRELREETGYVSDDWRYYFTRMPPSTKLQWSNHFYIARNCTRVYGQSLDSGEKIDIELVSFDQFLQLADDSLWRHQDLIPTMLRARYVPEKRRELEALFFG